MGVPAPEQNAEQVQAAQKALSALKALRSLPRRVTPQQRVVRRTTRKDWSPTSTTLFDENVLKGVESGLKFWVDEGQFDSCLDELPTQVSIGSDDDDDDDESDYSDDGLFEDLEDDFEDDGAVDEVELTADDDDEVELTADPLYAADDEREDDPYSEKNLEGKDEAASLWKQYEDGIDDLDTGFLLPPPPPAAAARDGDDDDDPYSNDQEELDEPAALEQHYADTQDDVDEPALLCAPPRRDLVVADDPYDAPASLRGGEKTKCAAAVVTPNHVVDKSDDDDEHDDEPYPTYMLVADTPDFDYDLHDDADQPGLLGLACF